LKEESLKIGNVSNLLPENILKQTVENLHFYQQIKFKVCSKFYLTVGPSATNQL